MIETLSKLAGLAVVAAVGVGAVLLLLRLSDSRGAERPELEPGFPPGRFPDRELVTTPGLAGLAATQARLLAIYRGLPPESELAVWLFAFLRELRAVMDTAYRAAAVAQLYGQEPPLDALQAEVARIEADLAAQLARRVLDRDGDTQRELLEGRLAALRLCARQLNTGS